MFLKEKLFVFKSDNCVYIQKQDNISTSLKRLTRKLRWNCCFNQKERKALVDTLNPFYTSYDRIKIYNDENNTIRCAKRGKYNEQKYERKAFKYHVVFTISEEKLKNMEFDEEKSEKQSLSNYLRDVFNRIKTYLRKYNKSRANFTYVCRVERGLRRSRRLHVHVLTDLDLDNGQYKCTYRHGKRYLLFPKTEYKFHRYWKLGHVYMSPIEYWINPKDKLIYKINSEMAMKRVIRYVSKYVAKDSKVSEFKGFRGRQCWSSRNFDVPSNNFNICFDKENYKYIVKLKTKTELMNRYSWIGSNTEKKSILAMAIEDFKIYKREISIDGQVKILFPVVFPDKDKIRKDKKGNMKEFWEKKIKKENQEFNLTPLGVEKTNQSRRSLALHGGASEFPFL